MEQPARDPRPGRVVVSAAAIAARVEELAEEIAGTAPPEPAVEPLLHLVCVLKGSLVFTADLARALGRRGVTLRVDTVRASSYGGATEPEGPVELTAAADLDLAGRDVLVVEDVVDTGLTVARVVEHLAGLRPRRLRLVALLDKPGRRRRHVTVDHRGFVLGDDFVVGYGLDLGERWRELPDVHLLEPAP